MYCMHEFCDTFPWILIYATFDGSLSSFEADVGWMYFNENIFHFIGRFSDILQIYRVSQKKQSLRF